MKTEDKELFNIQVTLLRSRSYLLSVVRDSDSVVLHQVEGRNFNRALAEIGFWIANQGGANKL